MIAADRLLLRLAYACSLTGFGSLAAEAQQSSASAPQSLTTTKARMAAVTYISGASIYIGAGRLDGVREGMSLDVLRGGQSIAIVRVVFLASHSSSCETVSGSAAPTVGDSVRYQPAADNVTASQPDTERVQPRAIPRSSIRRRPIRGRVGLGYLSLEQPNALEGPGRLNQPSADVHIDGSSLAGGMLGFSLDARSRRTIGASQLSNASLDQRTLIYAASLSATHTETGARLSVGRQYSAALPSVGLFDGLTVDVNRARWGAGLFSGAQPDVATMRYSTEVRETGAYLQLHNRPASTVPWSVSSGAIGSRDLGQIDREFGFMQFVLNSQLVSVYAMQEVDVNRGWKRADGESALAPTSTFASLSVRPLDELSVQGGFDNRRNVRLYRDHITPETTFDDAFREGLWGGASYVVRQRIRLGADLRLSRGGAAGRADSYTTSLGAGPYLSKRLDVRLRSTRYRTVSTTGWLHALTAGADPLTIVHVELNAGLRTQHLLDSLGVAPGVGAITIPSDAWFGASADVSIGRSWYALLSMTRDNSGVDLTKVLYSSLVYRF